MGTCVLQYIKKTARDAKKDGDWLKNPESVSKA